VVGKNIPVNTIEELLAYARKNPGVLSFASSGVGSSSHLAGELFKYRAGIDIFHVPYRGTSLALQDLISGNVTMAIDAWAAYKGSIESGSLKLLGVATAGRLNALPNVQAISEVLPGFQASPLTYISVRGGTSREIIILLNKNINLVLQMPSVKNKLIADGLVPQGNQPNEMSEIIKIEAQKWQHVIQVSGAKAQ